MTAVQDQEKGYRRGLVLGLTMAEIFLLVVFVLLLVLGTLFTRQTKEVDQIRKRITELEHVKTEIRSMAQATGLSPGQIITELAQAEQNRKRLAKAEQELNRLKILEQTLDESRPKGSENQPLPETFRELVLLRDAVIQSGLDASPEALKQALAEGEAAKEALSNTDDKDFATLVTENTRLARKIQNFKSQMANLRRQANRGGHGLDHPPCWANNDGKAEYIFDVALTSQGLIVRERNLPHRKADRAELPLDGVALDKGMSRGMLKKGLRRCPP